MRKDFALTARRWASPGTLPRLRRMPFKVMYEQVGLAILRQLDFRAEVASLVALRENLAGFPDMRIPAPMPDLCTDETVVMEFVEDLRQFEPGDLDAGDRRGVVRSVLAVIYEMLFIDGLVHCDLHPGNLYIERGAGPGDARRGLRHPAPGPGPPFVRRLLHQHGDWATAGCARRSWSTRPRTWRRTATWTGFRAALGELVTESSGARAAEFELARFAGRLFDLQRRFGLFPAPEFAFPLLSLLVIEGMIKGFDADVDFQAEAMPVLARRNIPRKAAASFAER